MNQSNMTLLFSRLEELRREIEKVEFWSARDLQELFDYKEWRNFEKAIQKAMISCENASESISNHFVEANKIVLLGAKGSRNVKDYALTRYAGYYKS